MSDRIFPDWINNRLDATDAIRRARTQEWASWINGVNVARSPSLPADGRCPACHEPFTDIETSAVIATRRPGTERSRDHVEPAPVVGPYFVPCHHDAAAVFGGRTASA